MFQVNNIAVFFGGTTLFEKVTFTLQPRDRVGLVGKNGAGKSTLLKIIAGEKSPDTGNLSFPQGFTIGYLKQDIRGHSQPTLRDEVATAFAEVQKLEQLLESLSHQLETRTDYESDGYMDVIQQLSDGHERLAHLDPDNCEKNLELVLKGLGFSRDDLGKHPSTFSGGWAMRIELAKILLSYPDLLLLDEPTNHLDIESIIWLEKFLTSYEGAVVIVSHDRTFLDNATNRTIEIENAKLSDYKVPYSQYLVQKEDRYQQQVNAFNNQQRELKQMERNVERFRAKASKASFAQSLIKKIEKTELIEVEDADNSAIRFRFPDAPHSGKISVDARGLTKYFGDKRVFENIDIEIERGQKVAFVGKNGMGKTTLSRILVGDLEPTSGHWRLGHQVQVGYYAQHQAELLNGNHTVLETMENAATETTRPQVRHILGAFLFRGDDVSKKVKVLSGGERSRLCLARLLLRPHNMLVLDEPTNHLDMRSKDILKEALLHYTGTIILVSHDRDFLDGLAEKIFEFRDGQVKEHLYGVTEFLKEKQLEDMRALENPTEQAKKNEPKAVVNKPVPDTTPVSTSGPKPPADMGYEERKQWSREERALKKKIEQAEEEIDQKQATLKKLEISPAMASGDADALKKYETLKQEIADLEEEWTNLQLTYEERYDQA
jgi:ATP-binding cassette, subfamily F, member 3